MSQKKSLFKKRIIGAQCMISSVRNQRKLPKSEIPIYSSSMANLIVCCSNVEKKIRVGSVFLMKLIIDF